MSIISTFQLFILLFFLLLDLLYEKDSSRWIILVNFIKYNLQLWQVLSERPQEPPEVSRWWDGHGEDRPGRSDQAEGGVGAGRGGGGGAEGDVRGSVWCRQGEISHSHSEEDILLDVFLVEIHLRQALEEESQEYESENK